MARVAGVDLPREKRGEVAVTYIYGLGRSTGRRDHVKKAYVSLKEGQQINIGGETA